MRKWMAGGLVAGLLAGCVAEMPYPGPQPQPEPPGGRCGAAELQGLVGQKASVLDAMRFSQPVRIIRPGMAVTMDYSAERLNIEIGNAGKIKRVSCG